MKKILLILVAIIGICSSLSAKITYNVKFKSDEIKSYVVNIDLYNDGSCGYTKGNTEYSGTYECTQDNDIFYKRITMQLYDEYTGQYFYLKGRIYEDYGVPKSMAIDGLGRFSLRR